MMHSGYLDATVSESESDEEYTDSDGEFEGSSDGEGSSDEDSQDDSSNESINEEEGPSASSSSAPTSSSSATTSTPTTATGTATTMTTTTATESTVENERWRIADGDGILCAKIECAVGLARSSRALVKVSYVEPGAPGASVLFRSKQIIHETKAVADMTTDPVWRSSFEYDIFKPATGDWRHLEGDLLFTVYEDQLGQRRLFLGQTMVPLNYLLDCDFKANRQQRIHGGTQRVGLEQYSLADREGKLVNGKLALELKLELPPDEPSSDHGVGDHQGLSEEYCGRINDNDNVEDDDDEASEEKVSLSKRPSKSRSLHPSVARERHLHRVRRLQRRQIDRENEHMQARIRSVKSTMKTQKPCARKHTRHGESKATEAWRKGHPHRRKFATSDDHDLRADELSVLTREAGALRQQAVRLQEEISHLRSGIARDETLLRRQKLLEQEMDRAHQESKSRDAVRKVRARTVVRMGAGAESGSLAVSPPRAAPQELRKLKYRVLRALEAQGPLDKEARSLLARRTKAQESLNESTEQIRLGKERRRLASQAEEERIARTRSRQVSDAVDATPDTAGPQDLAHELRVELAVAKERLALDQEAAKHACILLQDDMDRLHAKHERKNSKIDQARRELEEVETAAALDEERRQTMRNAAGAEASTLRAAIAQIRHWDKRQRSSR